MRLSYKHKLTPKINNSYKRKKKSTIQVFSIRIGNQTGFFLVAKNHKNFQFYLIYVFDEQGSYLLHVVMLTLVLVLTSITALFGIWDIRYLILEDTVAEKDILSK